MSASLRVHRVAWSSDPAELARSLEPVLARLHACGEALDPGPGPWPGPGAERGERARAAGAVEGLVRAGEHVLAEIEALEATKGRVEADLLAAYGALHTIEAQQVDALPANAVSRVSARVSPDRVVAEEIALATGVGVGEVARRLGVATAPRRFRTLLGALRAGETSLHRVLQVASETAPLPDADVTAVVEAVLAPARDGRPVPQRTFVSRLRRAVASLDARGAQERRSRARARRGVFGRLVEDGMGCLTVTADAATVAAVMDRLDAAARARRGGGDPRTLDQLRCDLATAALLRNGLDTSIAGSTAPTGRASSAGGPTEAAGETTAAGPGPVAGDAAARVWLVVPFEVADGASDAACELPGHGWVTAAHAREVMTRPGSLWQTLPVDLRDGAAIAGPTRSYRPTTAMVEHVRAVDGVCRGPGCEVLATRCDLDHETPWPAGPTTVDNLHVKHRLHHNLKTDGLWTSKPVRGDGLEWTTLTGRRYTTHPKNWRAGLDPPDPPPF